MNNERDDLSFPCTFYFRYQVNIKYIKIRLSGIRSRCCTVASEHMRFRKPHKGPWPQLGHRPVLGFVFGSGEEPSGTVSQRVVGTEVRMSILGFRIRVRPQRLSFRIRIHGRRPWSHDQQQRSCGEPKRLYRSNNFVRVEKSISVIKKLVINANFLKYMIGLIQPICNLG